MSSFRERFPCKFEVFIVAEGESFEIDNSGTKMAADSNMGFHQGVMPSTLQKHHMLSFQSWGSFNDAGPVNMRSSGQIGSTAGVFVSGSPSGMMNNSMAAIAGPSSSTNHHLDPAAAGIKQESWLSPGWMIEEQNTLKEGLIKYVLVCGFMQFYCLLNCSANYNIGICVLN